MATRREKLLWDALTGTCFPSRVDQQITIGSSTRPPGEDHCTVLPDPGGAGDHGVKGSFSVPPEYSSTPVLRISGLLDGAPTTTTIAFGSQMGPRADDEAYDTDMDAEDTASASSVSQGDEDIYVETITLTNTFAAGDDVSFFVYVDDSAHTYGGNFLLRRLEFEYDDGT